MKKGIVVLLVLMAAVVIVSPAIVGRLAEQTMDENLNWAASESGDLKVTSEQFTRGWFSSEGQHRIELRDGELLAALRTLTGPVSADSLPVLIVNTRLDHGLIPVTSMTRDKGSLAPGLGSAISTMQVELPDGETVDVPGTIYSKVALGGKLHSNYVLEAGSRADKDMSADWGNVDISVTTDPTSGEVAFDGSIGSLSLKSGDEMLSFNVLEIEGQQLPTRFGFAVGDLVLSLDALSVGGGMGNGARMSRLDVAGESSLDGSRLDARGRASMMLDTLPLGAHAYDMEFRLDGVDAAALGALQAKIGDMRAYPDPFAAYAPLEADAKRLFAAGFEFNIDRLEVAMPQGLLTSVMRFSFAEGDPDSFDWTSLLLATEASIDLSMPVDLINSFAQQNPQVAIAIGGGYLVKRGDAYVLEARLDKGLLTVNGAPIPIPLGAM